MWSLRQWLTTNGCLLGIVHDVSVPVRQDAPGKQGAISLRPNNFPVRAGGLYHKGAGLGKPSPRLEIQEISVAPGCSRQPHSGLCAGQNSWPALDMNSDNALNRQSPLRLTIYLTLLRYKDHGA